MGYTLVNLVTGKRITKYGMNIKELTAYVFKRMKNPNDWMVCHSGTFPRFVRDLKDPNKGKEA